MFSEICQDHKHWGKSLFEFAFSYQHFLKDIWLSHAEQTIFCEFKQSEKRLRIRGNANRQLTLGGIASICFKFHFQTDYQQTLRTHTQECQGCQKIRNFVRNSKILIARSTIHPSLSKIKNHYRKTSKIEKKNH